MRFLVRVRVNKATLMEFGSKLQGGDLDRSCIRGETFCVKDDPAVGYSVWEAEDREQFEKIFGPWRPYYTDVEVTEVITPLEAFARLLPGA
jgi:hypothetical protein